MITTHHIKLTQDSDIIMDNVLLKETNEAKILTKSANSLLNFISYLNDAKFKLHSLLV